MTVLKGSLSSLPLLRRLGFEDGKKTRVRASTSSTVCSLTASFRRCNMQVRPFTKPVFNRPQMLDDALEAAPIGWQLFILGGRQSASTAFLLLLDSYSTRLLAQALSRVVCRYTEGRAFASTLLPDAGGDEDDYLRMPGGHLDWAKRYSMPRYEARSSMRRLASGGACRGIAITSP